VNKILTKIIRFSPLRECRIKYEKFLFELLTYIPVQDRVSVGDGGISLNFNFDLNWK
jgi:hypothetical protein